MKALSLWQPWAGFVATGAKKNETRGKGTGYRGLLAIHAAKKWGRELEDLTGNLNGALAIRGEHARMVRIRDEGKLVIPRGYYVAVVRLVACEVMTAEMINEAGELQRQLGDWRPGRWAWRFSQVAILEEPIPARGYQWLWTPTSEEIEEIKTQIGLEE